MTMQMNDRKVQAPTPNTGDQSGAAEQSAFRENLAEWLKRGQAAYQFSTSYMDSNYRKSFDDSLRAFNSEHPNDSKYTQPAYQKRSNIYRPKTRMVIRKNEAAGAAAFFSNMDVVDVRPRSENSKADAAGASIMKEILAYRLEETIPWYQTVLGGLQDAQTVGAAIGHVYWEYVPGEPIEAEEEEDEPQQMTMSDEYPEQAELPQGAMAARDGDSLSDHVQSEVKKPEFVRRKAKPISDKPVIDLIPIENFRFAPEASWVNPVVTSPYIIHIMPVYVMDVKAKMEEGEWLTYGDEIIKGATGAPDSTRSARQKGRDDPLDGDSVDIDDYSIVWIQRHIHRKGYIDYEFYMLGDQAILTEPVKLSDIVFHGKRPYVFGVCNLETHKAIPSSLPSMSKGLQDEANEIANQRLDNVKFVLNKKFFVKRGRDADLQGLIRNVPGGVVMLEDPEHDVKEMTWPDVTQSSYEEQNRIDRDMDELLGSFSPAQLMADRQLNAPARNMAMLNSSTGTMTEYLLKTFVVTFVQPILGQLMLLEQKYETDEFILHMAADKAKAFQKFGLNEITDSLLEKGMILKVNVGMGATDPERKLNKFITGISAFSNVIKEAVPGLDYQEVGKEIFGHMGYADGSRFFNNQDPQVALLTQQLKQATEVAQQLQQQVKAKKEVHMMGLQKNRETIEGSIKKTIIHEQNENKRALATHIAAIDASSKEGKEEPIPAERQEAMKMREMNMKHERERENNHLKFAGQLHKTEREHQAKLTLGAGLRNSEERAA